MTRIALGLSLSAFLVIPDFTIIGPGAISYPFRGRYTIWTIEPREVYDDSEWVLVSDNQSGNTWPDKDSIHYSKPATIAIGILKNVLFGLKDMFADSVVLSDYNGVHKDRYPDWQYPPLADWVINKADVLAMVEKELSNG